MRVGGISFQFLCRALAVFVTWRSEYYRILTIQRCTDKTQKKIRVSLDVFLYVRVCNKIGYIQQSNNDMILM